jgi:cholesterol oxidase
MTDTHFDAVIVGSGFGGSVSAYRLADGGMRVCVLERGKAYPPGSFARRPRDLAANVWDPSEGAHGLFNVWSFRGIEAVISSGLGGGSLIYANVLLRKDERWFTQRRPDGKGYETWPVGYADLEPHYEAVETMLGSQTLPFDNVGYSNTAKTRAMKEAGSALGLPWSLANLAVTFANPGRPPVPGETIVPGPYPNLHGRTRLTCRMCGECDIGCNDGSKNTLDHTYLSAAKHLGADIRTRAEVRSIAPRNGGGYVVEYVEHVPENEGQRTKTDRLPRVRVTADRLIVAAGALGSPYLLLRNRKAFPGIGAALGTRFCGNGDLLGFALRAKHDNGQPRWLEASRGPVITSYVRVADEFDTDDGGGRGRGPGYYVEDAGYPIAVDWLLEGTTVHGTTRRLAGFVKRRLVAKLTRHPKSDLSAEIGELLGEADLSAASLPLLGMGRDVPDGVMRLRGNMLDVKWTTATSARFFSRLDGTMRSMARTWGADFQSNPLSRLHRVITVHPLGGCPMADAPSRGVVDGAGQVFNHRGMYVADGSVMPGPVGANPALTIAAFADRMSERILDPSAGFSVAVGGGVPLAEPVAEVDVDTEPGGPTQLEFTEEMKGFVTLADVGFEEGYRAGRESGTAFMFHLTIWIDDVDRFVADADHTASADGWVECEPLGGRRPVERAIFNLFVDDERGTEMRYRLWFTDGEGRPVTLTGFKVIKDDPGFDTWRDTTTLYTRLLDGHVEAGDDEGAVRASGIITIHLPDFLKQLTTFRTHGPDAKAEAAAMAAFGSVFLGKLWDVYRDRAMAGGGADPTA